MRVCIKRVIVIIALCVIALPVFAQTQTPIREQRDTMRNEAREAASARKQIEQRQAEFKSMVSAKREEAKASIDKKRADLRQRLQNIHDERKKKTVERIDAQIDALNERWTSHFSTILDRLEIIVGKIEERITQEEQRGSDISTVKSMVAEAKSAIVASRTAVVSQAGKTYSIAVSTEETLREETGKTRKELHRDLVIVRDTVLRAREMVHVAAVALAQVTKKEPNQATTTQATQNIQ
ncbi:MAG: hypothetical protein NUV61_01795 [Candidatus Azambacteria bacterium]|nr:hypothetical protein [Candidatus Azambacteria bacterium]